MLSGGRVGLSLCRSLANCSMLRCGRHPASTLPVDTLFKHIVRHYRASASQEKTSYPVFKNSLEKTLSVQRAVNRSQLLRKVYYDRPSPNIFRPTISDQNWASGQQSAVKLSDNEALSSLKPATIMPGTQNVQHLRQDGMTPKRLAGRTRRGRRVTKRQPAREAGLSLTKQASWSVDESAKRPVQYPWLRFLGPHITNIDALVMLDAEIRSLESYLRPTGREEFITRQVLQELSALLDGIVPRAPQVVGSRHTGMALSHSNLDLVILVNGLNDTSGLNGNGRHLMRANAVKTYRDILYAAEAAIGRSSIFHHCHMSYGRSPALSMVHQSTGIPLRISCRREPHASIEYITRYQMEYPELRPLYLTLRMILDTRDSFGADRSSIRPYGLLMLIVAVLKLHNGRFSLPDNLGERLLTILEVYGTRMNLETTGVAVDPPGFFDYATLRREEQLAVESGEEPAFVRGQRALLKAKVNAGNKANHLAARQLCIQDPANYLRNVGWPCVRTAELQNVIAEASQRLQTALDEWDGTNDCNSKSILGHALQANFDNFEQARSRIVQR